jgi:dihydroorotate dehydrogenase (NAD+) catalytic subunit
LRTTPAQPDRSPAEAVVEAPSVDLSVDLGRGLVLATPILAASGPFGYGVEQAGLVELDGIGAIVTRSTTLKPRAGNPGRRVASVPGGLLNAIGLQNPGIDAVVDRLAPAWTAWRVPVVVSLAAASAGEFAELARRLDGVPGVAGVELNLSCPNVARGGTLFALEADAAASAVAAVRRACDLPLLAKLSPNATDPRTVARAVADAGADALVAVNTLAGFAVSPDGGRPLLGNGYGGLSGPALRPVALRVVFEVAAAVDVPVVGIGGITGLRDALDFLAVGAAAVGVGVAVLADPALPVRLAAELGEELERRGLAAVDGLVGTALPRRTSRPAARLSEYRP